MNYLLLFAAYWVVVFTAIMAIYAKWATVDGTIDKDAIGICFVASPIIPLGIIATGLYTGTFYCADKLGVDLENFKVKRGSFARVVIHFLADLVAWVPSCFGLRVTESSITRSEKDDYEWRAHGKGEWVKEAEDTLRSQAVYEFICMDTARINDNPLADDDCVAEAIKHTIN